MNDNARAENTEPGNEMRDLGWLYFLAQQRGYDDLADEISRQAAASQLRLDDIESQLNDWPTSRDAAADVDGNVVELPVACDETKGWKFTLYVTGRRNQAFSSLREVLADRAPDSYSIRVVNVDRNPGAAERDGIIFTPTIIGCYGNQRLEFVGDISHTAEVRRKLALAEQVAGSNE